MIAKAELTVEGQSLIDNMLRDQQTLTAVDRFSQRHSAPGSFPSQQKYYLDLIPLDKPGNGQQYAFEVDLDKCAGCKACVAACHSLNGLDETETWRDVGLLMGGTYDEPTFQHVTTACHHCLEPACMEGCPTNAYDKDPVTGIVKHLDDQCIGCHYCTLTCPYDVPKYNHDKGIVRKCDMCSDRLAVGEAPACVQSCTTSAIAIRIVDNQHVIDDCETGVFLPGAPVPDITLPTTNYKTSKPFPRNTRPADYYHEDAQHAHTPLVVMLVLTQLSVGGFLMSMVFESLLDPAVAASVRPAQAIVSLALGLLALGASVFHLGRPLYAYRAIVGLGTSWLSREIVAFGLFAGLASLYAGYVWLFGDNVAIIKGLGAAVVASGVLGVFCSVMIYHSTRRELWEFARSGMRFTMTTLLLGVTSAMFAGLAAAAWMGQTAIGELIVEGGRVLCWSVVGLTLVKLVYEGSIFRHLANKHHTMLKRSALLMIGELRSATIARFVVGGLGGIALPTLLDAALHEADVSGNLGMALGVATAIFLASIVGELIERYLYFTAVVSPRMPGGGKS